MLVDAYVHFLPLLYRRSQNISLQNCRTARSGGDERRAGPDGRRTGRGRYALPLKDICVILKFTVSPSSSFPKQPRADLLQYNSICRVATSPSLHSCFCSAFFVFRRPAFLSYPIWKFTSQGSDFVSDVTVQTPAPPAAPVRPLLTPLAATVPRQGTARLQQGRQRIVLLASMVCTAPNALSPTSTPPKRGSAGRCRDCNLLAHVCASGDQVSSALAG